jgi:hypothetical protein
MKLRSGVLFGALFGLLSIWGNSNATPLGLESGGPGDATNSWQVNATCGGCGPVTTAEFFIVNDTGAGPFDTQGVVNPIAGWSTDVVNPNYSKSTGPSDDWSFWTEYYLGDITQSVTVNLLFWNGDPLTNLTFSAAYSRTVNGSLGVICQSFTSQLCGGMAFQDASLYDRSDSSVPVPPALALIGIGLLGIGYQRRKRLTA